MASVATRKRRQPDCAGCGSVQEGVPRHRTAGAGPRCEVGHAGQRRERKWSKRAAAATKALAGVGPMRRGPLHGQEVGVGPGCRPWPVRSGAGGPGRRRAGETRHQFNEESGCTGVEVGTAGGQVPWRDARPAVTGPGRRRRVGESRPQSRGPCERGRSTRMRLVDRRRAATGGRHVPGRCEGDECERLDAKPMNRGNGVHPAQVWLADRRRAATGGRQVPRRCEVDDCEHLDLNHMNRENGYTRCRSGW
jgi:hypothetical protein